MSESCEHPFCTRTALQKCSNHCQLDLCEEHFTEHRNLFLVQYEKSFSQIGKSFTELIKLIDEQKANLNSNYQKQRDSIHENYRKKRLETDEKSRLVQSVQKLIETKVQLLTDMKHDKAMINQHDIEQMKLYLRKLQQYPLEEEVIVKKIERVSTNLNVDQGQRMEDEDDDEESDDDNDNDEDDDFGPSQKKPRNQSLKIILYHDFCPLTQLGVFGFEEKHGVRLCSTEKNRGDRQLLAHLQNYHHLTASIAYRLTKAVRHGLNPRTTRIFSSEHKLSDIRCELMECPLKTMKIANCKSKLYQTGLKQHLISVHQLTLKTTSKILQAVKVDEGLTHLELDEDELK
ncbi:unnamed protein product [Adineta ricciae]|uniref:Uncharacterized protein n=1 Tax=Adineta ricciae TaxID=249248 RepID=A0A813PXY3_ADIRI|nr:unnamed protein product [Adineta ricciae]CAF1139689.1 unnamed protein product [Adineta ricciae]